MNAKDLKKTIDGIIKDSSSKVCILVDGKWGIGKTYAMEELLNNYSAYEYISIFGKNSVEQVEKDLMSRLIIGQMHNFQGGEKIIKIFKTAGSSVINLGTDMFKNKYGVDISSALMPIINNLSISSIAADDNTIICIDDIERKSNNVNIVELLGLIESISNRFNLIIIANTEKFNKDADSNDYIKFKEFKEKIIDYEFSLTEVDMNLRKNIMSEKIKIENVEFLICVFDECGIKNIRLYNKYVDLLYRLNKKISELLGRKEFFVDEKLARVCAKVIANNYIENEDDENKESKPLHRRKNKIEMSIYNCIENIYRYSDFSIEILLSYFDKEREINRDIHKLDNIYKFSGKEEILKLFDKIDSKIRKKDKNYFQSQIDIINLYNCIVNLHCSYKIKDKYDILLDISRKLYNPIIGEEIILHDVSYWNEFDLYSSMEMENKVVIDIVNDINDENKRIYKMLYENKINNYFKHKDYDNLSKILLNSCYLEMDLDIKYEDIFYELFEIQDYDEVIFDCLIYSSYLAKDRYFLKKIKYDGIIEKYRIDYIKEQQECLVKFICDEQVYLDPDCSC